MVISVQGILVLLKKSQQLLVSIGEILHDELKIKRRLAGINGNTSRKPVIKTKAFEVIDFFSLNFLLEADLGK